MKRYDLTDFEWSAIGSYLAAWCKSVDLPSVLTGRGFRLLGPLWLAGRGRARIASVDSDREN